MTDVKNAPGRSAVVGLLGCGNISDRYVTGMRRFPELKIAGCADVNEQAAKALADRTGIRAYNAVQEMLADPDIEIIVNITPPILHEQTTQAILAAGKHVYVEKPITTDPDAALSLLAEAKEKGLLVGSAPDTFLGSASQTARKALDEGVVGEPIAALACIRYSRAEEWHPDPTFLFQPGGGPSLDLGPYYITVLVNLFGPVAEVSAFSRIGPKHRAVTGPNRRVDSIEVTTPTHASASLRFESGVIATVISSFDIWDTDTPFIEVYGEQGTLQLGDPNNYDTPVRIRRHSDNDWVPLDPAFPLSGEPGTREQLLRGIGVADLAATIHGSSPRASGALAQHVLEVIAAFDSSSERSDVIKISSTVQRPEPVETHVS